MRNVEGSIVLAVARGAELTGMLEVMKDICPMQQHIVIAASPASVARFGTPSVVPMPGDPIFDLMKAQITATNSCRK